MQPLKPLMQALCPQEMSTALELSWQMLLVAGLVIHMHKFAIKLKTFTLRP
jgi:hypothetical protein